MRAAASVAAWPPAKFLGGALHMLAGLLAPQHLYMQSCTQLTTSGTHPHWVPAMLRRLYACTAHAGGRSIARTLHVMAPWWQHRPGQVAYAVASACMAVLAR